MRLLGDRLLISPLPDQEQTSGGIILPMAQTGDVRHYWRVEQVGPGKRDKKGELQAPEFAVGDLVVTPLHFSHTTLEDGSGWKIVDCEQVIGKLAAAEFVPEILPTEAPASPI